MSRTVSVEAAAAAKSDAVGRHRLRHRVRLVVSLLLVALQQADPAMGATGQAYLVKDIWPGSPSSFLSGFAEANGYLFFAAHDGVHGVELWKSDGTEQGTVLVKDIGLGFGSEPGSLTNLDGTLFFAATDATAGRELWKSDGTAAGTVLVKDIPPTGFSSGPTDLTPFNHQLFFSAAGELWKSDGTTAGTIRVRDFPGSGGLGPSHLTSANGILFFAAFDPATGFELWKSDGTDTGTDLVKDIKPGTDSSNPVSLVNVNGTLVFLAFDGTHGVELWKSDGTAAGTVLVKDIYPGSESGLSSFSAYLTNVDGTLFFAANDGVHGVELWKSDGTDAGTVLVKDIFLGGAFSDPSYLTALNGAVYFAARDSTFPSLDVELWRSDGTETSTVRVKDITPGPLPSSPTGMVEVNGMLFFSASDAVHGQELWKSDGTEAGTELVDDIVPGLAGSLPRLITVAGSHIFFAANDWVVGEELWATAAPAPSNPCSLSCDASSAPATPFVGTSVQFAATVTATGCSGTPGLEWDFGDGSAHSSDQNPAHIYAAAGTYDWTMTASVPEAADCVRMGTVDVAPACTTPVIVTQPSDASIRSGSSALLSLEATGTPPPAFQWFVGPLGDESTPAVGPGSTSSSYATPPLMETTTYWVRVTNACGRVDGGPYTVRVLQGAPIIFVHGWCGDSSTWTDMIAELQQRDTTRYGPAGSGTVLWYDYSARSVKLQAHGLPNDRVFVIAFTNPFNATDPFNTFLVAQVAIEEKASQLKRVIGVVKALAQADQVILVGHSQGGLVARAYVQGLAVSGDEGSRIEYGNDVQNLVSIDAPNTGSPWARSYGRLSSVSPCHLAPEVSKAQMSGGSYFLTRLNSALIPPGVEVLSVASYGTNLLRNLLRLFAGGDGIVSYSGQNLKGVGPSPQDPPPPSQDFRNSPQILLQDNPLDAPMSCFSCVPEVHTYAPSAPETATVVDGYLRGRGEALESLPRITVDNGVREGLLVGLKFTLRLTRTLEQGEPPAKVFYSALIPTRPRPSNANSTQPFKSSNSGWVTFPSGTASQEVLVSLAEWNGLDDIVLTLTNPLNALLADAEGRFTPTSQ